MRDRILIGIAALLYYSGLMGIINWLHRRSGQRLLILNYHHACGEDLRRHLLYLRKHFHLIFLEVGLEELYVSTRNSHPQKGRSPSLALTFDDGYADNYSHAFALIRELQIPITIFLISGSIDSGPEMLTWSQVREMQASQLVAFGGHTLHHPVLASQTNTQEAYQEVAGCRSLLQEKLGQSARIFAYPYGGLEHIGVQGLLAAQRAGYCWAVTTIPGWNTPWVNHHLLRRVSADAKMHWLLIALVTSGLWDMLSRLHWLVKRHRGPTRSQLKSMGVGAQNVR